MNVVQYFRIVRRRWKLVAALAMIGAIAAFLLAPRPRSLSALDGPSSYVATHTLFVNAAAQSSDGTGSPVSLAQTPLLVTGGDVVDRVATATGEDSTVLLENVIARSNPALNTIDITYHDDDGVKATQIADEFAVQLTTTLSDLDTQRLGQQLSVLQTQRDQLQFLYTTLEGDPNDPVFKAKSDALLQQLAEVEGKLQEVNTVPGSDPYLLTLRSASPVPVSDAEYDAMVDAAKDPASKKAGETTSLQATSGIISNRGQAGVNPFLAAIGGAFLGALIGIGVALGINRLDPRLFTKEDAEEATGFPVIAEVPSLGRSQRHASHVVSRDTPYSRYAESFRALRSSILFVQHTGRIPGSVPGESTTLPSGPASPDETEKLGTTIMVTSPGPGEGKTTTVANLAAVMAEDGSKVLVVNCDFRRPRLHLYLDAPNETRKVANTSIPGVKLVAGVLDDKKKKSSPAEVLAAQRHLVTTARTMFDYILLDTAPILTTTDASEVLSVTDMVVMICRAGKTTAESADRAAELLERFQAPVIGGVVVGATDAPSSRYYYYYSDDVDPNDPQTASPKAKAADNIDAEDDDPFADLRRPSAAPSGDTADDEVGSKDGAENDATSEAVVKGKPTTTTRAKATAGRSDDVGTAADAPTS